MIDYFRNREEWTYDKIQHPPMNIIQKLCQFSNDTEQQIDIHRSKDYVLYTICMCIVYPTMNTYWKLNLETMSRRKLRDHLSSAKYRHTTRVYFEKKKNLFVV